MTWVAATKEEASAARADGQQVRFGPGGWQVWDQDLVKEAEEVFEEVRGPIAKTKDGQYVPNYVTCECGEAYLVEAEHMRYSEAHKKWTKGYSAVEAEEKLSAYPPGHPTPTLAFGVNHICERCKAKDKKGLDYYPDRDSAPHNRFPCRRCNGHGVRPND